MNFLVFLDAQAGELEKILSGTKKMLVKEIDPAQVTGQPVRPGDSLYFLRNKEECILRVKATVVRVLLSAHDTSDDLSHLLKEMQPKLQLTEAQYNYWSTKGQVMLVEFRCAQKIGYTHIASQMIVNPSHWIAFEEFSRITE